MNPSQVDPSLLQLAGLVNGEINNIKKNATETGTGLKREPPRHYAPTMVPNMPLTDELKSKLIPDVPLDQVLNNNAPTQPIVRNTVSTSLPNNPSEQPLNIHLAIWDRLGRIEAKLNEIDDKLTKKKRKKIKKFNKPLLTFKENSNDTTEQQTS